MDLVDYSEEKFLEIQRTLESFTSKLPEHDIHYIPISALCGDNVVERSNNMDWYSGSTLLYTLENTHVSGDFNHTNPRFPVQYVIRPQFLDNPDFRGYAGRVAGGVFKPGDKVIVLPSGLASRIILVDGMDTEDSQVFAPMSMPVKELLRKLWENRIIRKISFLRVSSTRYWCYEISKNVCLSKGPR